MRRLEKTKKRGLIARVGKKISKFAGAAVLAAGLALTPASVDGRAARPATVNVKGTKVKKVTLSSTVSALDRKSKSYRRGAWRVVVPTLKLDAKVTLNRRTKEVVLKHPNPVRGGAVLTKKDSLASFAALVKKVSRKDMAKVKMYVTTSRRRIIQSSVTYYETNIYLLPLDRKGRTIGGYQNGNLAVRVSYSKVLRKATIIRKATIKTEVVLLKQPSSTRCRPWDVNCLKRQGAQPRPGMRPINVPIRGTNPNS